MKWTKSLIFGVYLQESKTVRMNLPIIKTPYHPKNGMATKCFSSPLYNRKGIF